MADLGAYALVFVAGLPTALATGVGGLPFFFVADVSDPGFGFAAGAMLYLVATEFVPEALALGEPLPGRGVRELAAGFVAGGAGMVALLVTA